LKYFSADNRYDILKREILSDIVKEWTRLKTTQETDKNLKYAKSLKILETMYKEIKSTPSHKPCVAPTEFTSVPRTTKKFIKELISKHNSAILVIEQMQQKLIQRLVSVTAKNATAFQENKKNSNMVASPTLKICAELAKKDVPPHDMLKNIQALASKPMGQLTVAEKTFIAVCKDIDPCSPHSLAVVFEKLAEFEKGFLLSIKSEKNQAKKDDDLLSNQEKCLKEQERVLTTHIDFLLGTTNMKQKEIIKKIQVSPLMTICSELGKKEQSLGERLQNIKKICDTVPPATLHNSNRMTMELYSIFRKIDPRSPSSLEATLKKLQAFDNKCNEYKSHSTKPVSAYEKKHDTQVVSAAKLSR
jgi:hypothetical protein